MGKSGGALARNPYMHPDPHSHRKTKVQRQYAALLYGMSKGTVRKIDGCATNKPFKIQHALKYKVGGLVRGCHNEVWDSLVLMRTQPCSSYSTQYEPIISTSWYATVMVDPSTGQPIIITVHLFFDHANLSRGDLQISHLWQCQIDTIIDVRAINTYAKYYLYWPRQYVLATQCMENKINTSSLPVLTETLLSLHCIHWSSNSDYGGNWVWWRIPRWGI